MLQIQTGSPGKTPASASQTTWPGCCFAVFGCPQSCPACIVSLTRHLLSPGPLVASMCCQHMLAWRHQQASSMPLGPLWPHLDLSFPSCTSSVAGLQQALCALLVLVCGPSGSAVDGMAFVPLAGPQNFRIAAIPALKMWLFQMSTCLLCFFLCDLLSLLE